ncbi:MAG: glycosyltransferase family 4 protein [Patescibacteria group bacterium]
MRIAHIICTFPPYKGGMGNVAYEQAKELASLGHEVTVFTPSNNFSKRKIASHLTGFTPSNPREKLGVRSNLTGFTPNYSKEEKDFNFKVIRLKSLIKFGNAAFLPQLIYRLRKFDVVQLHHPFFGATEIVWLAKKLGLIKKLVVFCHMEFIPKNLFFRFFWLPDRIILKSLLNSSSKVVVSSLDYVRQLSINKYFKKNKEKFVEIPFGSQFNLPELKEKQGDKNILFVGALDKAHNFKGVDILLKSFKEVLAENPSETIYASHGASIKLNIVGGGDMKEEYIKQAKDLGIINKVNFPGCVTDEELKEYYANCDIFVLPSTDSGEAFGLVLVEAMSFAKPVIASDLPGVRTVCRDNINGFLVEPGNIQDLEEKMVKLIQDKELAQKMGRKSKEFVDEKYTWPVHVKKLEEVFHSVQCQIHIRLH